MSTTNNVAVTAGYVRRHFGLCLDRLKDTDFSIEKKGRVVAELRGPERDKRAALESLIGCVDAALDFEADKAERIAGI